MKNNIPYNGILVTCMAQQAVAHAHLYWYMDVRTQDVRPSWPADSASASLLPSVSHLLVLAHFGVASASLLQAFSSAPRLVTADCSLLSAGLQ
jgi:hypothetical protein